MGQDFLQREGELGFPGEIAGPVLFLYDNDSGQFHIASCNKGVKMLVNAYPAPPGGTIQTDADVAIGVGATSPLSFPSSAARTMTVQVTGGPGALVRVREAGAPAGYGIVLGYLDAAEYTAGLTQVDVENIGAVIATVTLQQEIQT